MNNRAQAARILSRVITQHCSLTDCLAQEKPTSFVAELCYGVLRWYPRLTAIADRLLNHVLLPNEATIYCLLLVGLYQLEFMRTPHYAAVSATVEAVRAFKNKRWAKGLLNATLRTYLRQRATLHAYLNTQLQAKFAHPAWLIEALQQAWPADWECILHANNQRPPLTLRINRQKITRAAYLNKLHEHNLLATPLPHIPEAINLRHPLPVEQLPGFAEGEISIQDGAAQLAAHLLELRPNQTVLDACAAPGGKTCHILELEPRLAKLIALDRDAQRVEKIHHNLQRLGLQAEVLVGDATQPDQWGGNQRFDRILLDAPCSATGVIRRHPDIKLSRRPSDSAHFQHQQLTLLNVLWPLLRPGGLLVYATCSILPTENVEVVQHFQQQHSDCLEYPIHAQWGIPQRIGRQILPGKENLDGFYYARWQKVVST